MERIGREVERELTRRGGSDLGLLSEITAVWPAIVGDAISRQAWPRRLAKDGTLHVATVSATWAQELGFLVDEILARLRSRFGPDAPTAMRCAPGPIPEAEAPAASAAPTSPGGFDVPPEVCSEAAAAAASIDDPELRELVARAARASLVKARSGRNF